MLAAGQLDVALVSSFEFLRNPIYRIVDGISISSDGPVYSVIVAHDHELADVREIALDPASETSVALLRHLLKVNGLTPRLVPGHSSASAAREGVAQLLIGDQALHFRSDHPGYRIWDLGEAWRQTAGIPFVYALWLVRRETANAADIAAQLRQIRDANMKNLETLVAEENGVDRAFLTRYYTEHLRFTFGDREKRGLQAFADACANLELVQNPRLVLDLV